MTCEFRLQLVACDQVTLSKILNKEYQGRLPQAYAHSAYSDGKSFQQADFCAGTAITGSLLLIYPLEADMLICYVEPEYTQDLRVVKKAINTYFQQIIRILKRNDISSKKPEASIIIEGVTFDGVVYSFQSRVVELFKEKWEKLILAPIASIAASYLAIQFNILDPDEAMKDVGKAVTLTLEGYIGLILVLAGLLFISSNRKEFKFNI